MNRRTVALLLAVLLGIAAPACGDEDSEPTPTPAAGQGGILDQPGRARDTVDDLNQRYGE